MNEKKSCVVLKYIAVAAVSGSFLFNSLAAEFSHEGDKNEQAAVLPRDTYEHPHEEHETTYQGETYRAVVSATGSVVASSPGLSVSWGKTILS
jgi:hypothetical protein